MVPKGSKSESDTHVYRTTKQNFYKYIWIFIKTIKINYHAYLANSFNKILLSFGLILL